MITGGVLLAAVVIDAVIRNQRQRAGALRQGVAPEPAGPAGAIARLEAPTPDVSVVPRGACAPSLS